MFFKEYSIFYLPGIILDTRALDSPDLDTAINMEAHSQFPFMAFYYTLLITIYVFELSQSLSINTAYNSRYSTICKKYNIIS